MFSLKDRDEEYELILENWEPIVKLFLYLLVVTVAWNIGTPIGTLIGRLFVLFL
ncbi:hypothetical protein [Spirochaeta dissipatitropha]